VFEIRWKKSAVKEIKSIQKKDQQAILLAVEKLKTDPLRHGVKKLTNSRNTYRLRIGNYRVVYNLLKSVLIVEIIRVRHRRDVYR